VPLKKPKVEEKTKFNTTFGVQKGKGEYAKRFCSGKSSQGRERAKGGPKKKGGCCDLPRGDEKAKYGSNSGFAGLCTEHIRKREGRRRKRTNGASGKKKRL